MLSLIVLLRLFGFVIFFHELGALAFNHLTVYCDNISTTYLTVNLVFHASTKHIELDCHTICEQIQDEKIETAYVQTRKQITDIFMKPMG